MRCGACLMIEPAPGGERECSLCGGELKLESSDLLGDGGITSEIREPQLQLAAAVERALNIKSNCVAEAGTGTGKTLAYCIPAIVNGKRVVISTATIGLQNQIISKDLPFLKEKLGERGIKFSFAAAKGKSNYVCGRAVAAASGDAKTTAKFTPKFTAWAQAAMQGTGSSDKSDLGDEAPDAWWTVTAENCHYPEACPAYKTCAYVGARAAVADAQIVVANHAIVGLDLALSVTNLLGKTKPHPILKPYEVLVIDEAHKAVDYFRNAFSYTATKGMPGLLGHLLSKRDIPFNGAHHFEFEKALDSFFSKLPAPPGTEGYAKVEAVHMGSPALRVANDSLTAAAGKFLERPKQFLAGIKARQDAGVRVSDTDMTDFYTVKRVQKKVVELLDATTRTVDPLTAASNAVFTRWDNGELQLTICPVEISGILQARLYNHVKTVVLTSATLSVEGSFDTVKSDFGLEAYPECEVKVASPFDYDTQVGMYVSTQVPEAPKNYRDTIGVVGWAKAVASEVHSISQETQGRCFVLFTARTDMEAVATQLALKRVHTLKQSKDTTVAALVVQFRKDAAAGKKPVLLGLKSFWEGVDIAGDDLSAVIVPKLPFPPQTDPIYQARCEKAGSDWFKKVALPDMIKDLQQGTGRLIRTTTDVGIVALLDPRLTAPKSYYKNTVLRSLPFRKISTDLEIVKGFYRKIKAARDASVESCVAG